MAQDVNYKDALKPIEATLKAGNVDAKAFAKVLKGFTLFITWMILIESPRSA